MRVFSVLAPFVALVSAETFTVKIGKDNELTYDPPRMTVKKGDTFAYQFLTKNHTLTQSSFAKPCKLLTTPSLDVDSGYFPAPAGATVFRQWSLTLEDGFVPLWFFCARARNCQNGMVSVLNPTPETFEVFKTTAMGTAPPAGGSGSRGLNSLTTKGALPCPPGATGSRYSTATATDANISGTSVSGSSLNPNHGGISTGLAARSGLSGLMIVLGLSLFLI